MTLLSDPRPVLERARRAECFACKRPQSTCICACIRPVQNRTEVLILQHTLEIHQAKGSARLLHLCLPVSRIVSGEQFDQQELTAMLHAPAACGQGCNGQPLHPVLLYPDTAELAGADNQLIQKPSWVAPADTAQIRLVVLDGTWRKSRKMLYLNPVLQSLPRLPLRDMPASHYMIRKAHQPDQLSTLEASCYALMQLENDVEKYQVLLQAFDLFVAQQQGYADQLGRRGKSVQD